MSAGFDLLPFVLGCALCYFYCGVLQECAAATYASGSRRGRPEIRAMGEYADSY